MAYTLDQFIADCKSSLAREPGPPGREQVRANLEKLLANPDFLAQYTGDDQPKGVKVLYEDEKLGFQVLAHINEKAHASPPHDHGASWAIYGQATQYTDMTEWRRVNPESEDSAQLIQTDAYRLGPGQTRAYGPHMIHATAHPEQSWVVRVTGTDLDNLPRYRFHPKRDKILERA